MINRRKLLQTIGAGLCIPAQAFAQSANERKFLFVFCDGGWDPTMVFAPLLSNPNTFTESEATETIIQGLPLVDSPLRPTVRQFFEQWGEQCLIINGIDFETVAHDRGKRLLMTGKANGFDDWGALISASSLNNYTAPHLVMSGPTFTTYHPGSIVRVGKQGELYRLLHATDEALIVPNRNAEDLVQQYLQQRTNNWIATSDHGQRFHDNYSNSQAQLADVLERLDNISLSYAGYGDYGSDCNESFMAQASVALDFFEQGLSRCAIVQDNGYCRMRWDSHGDIHEQNWHYELLFQGLLDLMFELHQRQTITGTSLAEEVTVIVCSELGRHPQLNEMGGKHHWPVTSAMMIGGVTGGRVIGGYNDQVLSMPVDPTSAELFETGEKLLPGHIGATLLAMADVDPGLYTSQSPLLGVIE